MHNKNNSTLIKANFIKTANFLENLKGGIFNGWIWKTEEKTNTTRSTVLAFVEAPVRYKIELIEKTNEGIRRKYYWTNKNSS